ncbi:MAG: ATP-binding protein [Planctomycetales bacterium]|nr:ATP-binding protein [Planctomycetales bacterium]
MRLPVTSVDDFLIGQENQLLEAVVHELFSGRSSLGIQPANPVVLYGMTGTGKTHLALGIANVLAQQSPHRPGWALTGADWAREYAMAAEDDRLTKWRDDRRRANYFVLDGTAELLKKYAAQRELCLYLDELVATHVPCIVTCRSNPFVAPELTSPLASRLAGGLTVPLHAPGLAVREAFIADFARQHDLSFTDDALHLTAQMVDGTVPDIQAALLRSIQSWPAHGRIDVATVRRLLDANAPVDISVDAIVAMVARYFRVSKAKIVSPLRKASVAQARGIAIYLAREVTAATLKEIGSALGGRDHSTVLHGYRKTAELIAHDPAMHDIVQELIQILRRH